MLKIPKYTKISHSSTPAYRKRSKKQSTELLRILSIPLVPFGGQKDPIKLFGAMPGRVGLCPKCPCWQSRRVCDLMKKIVYSLGLPWHFFFIILFFHWSE